MHLCGCTGKHDRVAISDIATGAPALPHRRQCEGDNLATLPGVSCGEHHLSAINLGLCGGLQRQEAARVGKRSDLGEVLIKLGAGELVAYDGNPRRRAAKRLDYSFSRKPALSARNIKVESGSVKRPASPACLNIQIHTAQPWISQPSAARAASISASERVG